MYFSGPRAASPRDLGLPALGTTWELRAGSPRYNFVPGAGSPGYVFVLGAGCPGYIFVSRAASPWYNTGTQG